MRVPYRVIVEPQQYDNYAAVIDPARLLVLERRYQDEYETCDALGNEKSKGPGAARNFAWDHAVAQGAAMHWVMDDNIWGFYRMNRNSHVPVADGTVLRAMEDFVLQYTNIAMAGPDYYMFAYRKKPMPPFVLNTRIYSCNLIRNDAPFRWRARYNEDTDLSLRMLKAGWCTVLFHAFLQGKKPTQAIKGGNTEDFYAKEGTLPKSKMLVDLHPDCSRLLYRFSREHHWVDYGRFKKNRLIRRADAHNDAPPNYGLHIVPVEPHQRHYHGGAENAARPQTKAE